MGNNISLLGGLTMYYVTMTDKFMSGWGMAQGKTNKYVVICETLAQAQTVAYNAHKRREMKYVNICARMPRYGASYLVTLRTYAELGDAWTAYP